MRLVVVFISLLLFVSCNVVERKSSLKEGYIEYSMEYLNEKDITLANLLPKRMTIKFKNHNTINKIESFSGIVSFKHITDKEKDKHTTLVKLLNKKFRYEESMKKQAFCFDEFPGMEIELTDQTKEIAGFVCKKAIAKFPGQPENTFDIYYTNEINIDAPNVSTPFEAIDGVLLEFRVKLYNYDVRLTADVVKQVKVSQDEFNIPVDYKSVNKKEMEEIISLFE